MSTNLIQFEKQSVVLFEVSLNLNSSIIDRTELINCGTMR